MNKAIELEQISKRYRGKRMKTVEAVSGLSLELERGQVFGFVGPNGAGKSTTIKILAGLIRPSSGTAKINGIDVNHVDARRSVGYLPENPALYDFLSAEEYVRFVGKTFGMDNDVLARRTEEVLQLLDLWEARKRSMRGYSKGMVQRVGLAQALVHNPDVLIFDEPMSGLDPIGRALVKKIIVDLKSRGKTVFFSTHIISDVESICDVVGIIHKGVLRRVERIDEIIRSSISGYVIRYQLRDGVQREAEIDAGALPSFLAAQQGEGAEVLFVEPRRQNLEALFLDAISEA